MARRRSFKPALRQFRVKTLSLVRCLEVEGMPRPHDCPLCNDDDPSLGGRGALLAVAVHSCPNSPIPTNLRRPHLRCLKNGSDGIPVTQFSFHAFHAFHAFAFPRINSRQCHAFPLPGPWFLTGRTLPPSIIASYLPASAHPFRNWPYGLHPQ